MLDLRGATFKVTHNFDHPTKRAMQCPAPAADGSGDFYMSQAQGSVKPESIQISRQLKSTGINYRRHSTMRLVKAGHGSTIATLMIDGQLHVIGNFWGKLQSCPYVPGVDISKGDPRVKPIWSKSYAYIDHEAKTVCLRSGNAFWLYEYLGNDLLGAKLGEASKDMASAGPSQGYCTLKVDDDYQLFTMWDYGRATSKPAVVVGSLTTGKKLYPLSARLFSSGRNEPESGFGQGGKFYLGMARAKGEGVAIEFTPKIELPPVEPPVTVARLTGNDVASYQPLWSPAPEDSFAFVKATQGTLYVNPFRGIQVGKARDRGLVVGHYHYLDKGKDVIKQASHFSSKADIQPGDLLVLDWEGGSKRPTVAEAAGFIAAVKNLRPRNKVLLYCNRSDWMTTTVKAPEGLWIAEYGVKAPGTKTDWVFWQYTDKPIDRNWCKFGTLPELKAFATELEPPV